MSKGYLDLSMSDQLFMLKNRLTLLASISGTILKLRIKENCSVVTKRNRMRAEKVAYQDLTYVERALKKIT